MNRRRSGVIFVTALAVTVTLAALALVFTQSMRTELLASGNRASAAQAEAIELGGEQWVLAQIEANAPDAVAVSAIAAEAVPVGKGYFWILRTDPADDQHRDYGIEDEASKANLNVPGYIALPAMTSETAAGISDWTSPDPNSGAAGTYAALGYRNAGLPLQTPEELLLVSGVTPQMLWGFDRNRDGVLDEGEQSTTDFGSAFNAAGDSGRGFMPFATVFSIDPNTQTDGSPRLNVNGRNVQQLRNSLRTLLRDSITDAARADRVYNNLNTAIAAAQQRGASQWFNSLGTLYTVSGMTADEFATVSDKVTTTAGETQTGLINVNTASKQALATLPGLTAADADALIAARATADTSSFAWAIATLDASKRSSAAPMLTGRSYVYSADIVATSGDGRAYKRVRIVVDARQLPSKIIYRTDLTHLGWPLDRQVRAILRSGKGVNPTTAGAL